MCDEKDLRGVKALKLSADIVCLKKIDETS